MRDNRGVYDSLILIMQLGINMIVPILLCTWYGVWLSNETGDGVFAVAFFFAGAAAGVQNCHRLIKRMLDRDQQRNGSREIAMKEAAEAGQKLTGSKEEKSDGQREEE